MGLCYCTGFLKLWGAGATLAVVCELLSAVTSPLQHTGSRAQAGTWAQLLQGRWDFPISGTELGSPALAGRFFTMSYQGSPQHFL